MTITQQVLIILRANKGSIINKRTTPYPIPLMK